MDEGHTTLALAATEGPILRIRITDLLKHPSQREIEQSWVDNFHQTWGEAIDRGNNFIKVMAANDDPIPVSSPGCILDNIPGRKWFNISGQHRVEVLKKSIRLRLQKELNKRGISVPVSEADILADGEAYWLARTHDKR